jgi:glutathione S-transferase
MEGSRTTGGCSPPSEQMSERELPLLWQLRFSHYNEKARWALDYKQVAHRRRSLAPGTHPYRSRRLGGRGTTPMLDVYCSASADTTEIVARLEQMAPDPPLYPDTEIERRTALELEEHFDEQLGPGIRSAVFHAILPHRELTIGLVTQGLGGRRRAINNAIYPLIKVMVSRSLPADEATAQRGRGQVVTAMDLIESELNGDYLVGDRFSVADLTAAALLSPLVAPPEFAYELADPWPEEWEQFRRSLSDRPGYRWVQEMFKRHRGSSAAVSDD